MEELNLVRTPDKFLTLDKKVLYKTLTLTIGSAQQYEINKAEAKQIVEHLTKVFEL